MINRSIPLSLKIIPVTLLGELRDLINDARQRVAGTVNSELTLLNWRMPDGAAITRGVGRSFAIGGGAREAGH